MGADLSACPPPRTLERLLAEQLAGPERDAVESHVEGCAACQERLEALLNARTLREGRPDAAHQGEPEPAEQFLARLRQLSPPGSMVVEFVSPSAAGSQHTQAQPAWGGAAWLEGGRLGQYEVLDKLGRGGMGAVFKARHVALGKVVALKVLPAERMQEVTVARFKNEVRAIGKLDHPNIVTAHDAGESRGVHFLVMELVDGMDLARVVERHGRLSIADACEAVCQAAAGLQHAFERGLVHRDVKPPNLMLARDGRVRVLDLGLARSFGEAAVDTLTAHGVMLGTADYLAPEQWDHPHGADTRADVYGLGCTLYHLLAGRPPFAGESFASVPSKMRAHLEVPPPPIERSCPEAPAGLAAALDRMLAKDPAERYQTPAEVAAALRPFTAGADLARLLDAEDSAAGPSGLAAPGRATPEPGTWETAPARRAYRPVAGRGKGRLLPAVLAGLGVAVVAGLLWLAPGPAEPLEIDNLQVTHFRGPDREGLGDLRTSPAAVRRNDTVEVTAELSAPAYYYLIAFNPQGSADGLVQLCQPEGKDGKGAEAARPEQRTKVRYPGDTHDFSLDAVGLQAFVLAASTRPLPPYKEWRSRFNAIPWEGVKDGGTRRWHFDGQAFTRFPRERGQVTPREGAPEPLQKLRDFFTKRPEFEAVQIFAFPVADDPK